MAIAELLGAAIEELEAAASAAKAASDRLRQVQAAALIAEAKQIEQEIENEVDGHAPAPAAPDAPAPADRAPVRSAGVEVSPASETHGSPEPR